LLVSALPYTDCQKPDSPPSDLLRQLLLNGGLPKAQKQKKKKQRAKGTLQLSHLLFYFSSSSGSSPLKALSSGAYHLLNPTVPQKKEPIEAVRPKTLTKITNKHAYLLFYFFLSFLLVFFRLFLTGGLVFSLIPLDHQLLYVPRRAPHVGSFLAV
jgi:hypothetical protein